jgi:uncharacterized protein (TIGR02466 family)
MDQRPNLQLAIVKPFGPSIVKVKLPQALIDELNNYTETVIKDEARLKSLDHGPYLAGNVNQEILLEEDFMAKIKWTEFIGMVCNEWLRKTTGKELKGLKIINSWIVRQYQGEYNPVHHHAGHISGVAYLKIPQNMGNTTQQNKYANSNGNLVFINGSANLFANSAFEIKPEVGDFYMFPNYLDHAVYPFSGTNEERRSVSFNAILDPEAATY